MLRGRAVGEVFGSMPTSRLLAFSPLESNLMKGDRRGLGGEGCGLGGGGPGLGGVGPGLGGGGGGRTMFGGGRGLKFRRSGWRGRRRTSW